MKLIHRPREPSKYGRVVDILKIASPLVGVCAITLFTALFFGIGTSTALLAGYLDASCSPSGDFHLYTDEKYTSAGMGTRYNPYWQGSQFLSITLGFGRFPYALAKGIDVCWDLLVGRIGQLLLTLMAYPVIRQSLFSYMERTSARVPIYVSIAFEKISSRSLISIVRDFRTVSKGSENATRSPFWRLTGFGCVLAYILVFPTLVSVMTGYQANWIPYVDRPDNQALVKFSDLKTPPLVVTDGARVGLDNNHVVFSGDPDYRTFLAYGGTLTIPDWAPNMTVPSPICFSASYFNTPFVNGSISFRSVLLRDSQCNITSNRDRWTSSRIEVNGKIHSLEEPPLNVIVQTGWLRNLRLTQYLSIDRLALPISHLQAKGSCQPSAHYIWGFSSMLLFIFCILSVFFAAILASLHYESTWSSRTGRSKYELNTYRDAVDLVYDLQDHYFGEALREMSAEDLKKQCAGKTISLDTSELPLSWKEAKRLSRPTLDTGTMSRPGGIARNLRFWTLASIEFMKSLLLRGKSRDKIELKPLRPGTPDEPLKVEEND